MPEGMRKLRPDLSSESVREALPIKGEPYTVKLAYGCQLGLLKGKNKRDYWYARVRIMLRRYRLVRLGRVAQVGTVDDRSLSYEQAVAAAKRAFDKFVEVGLIVDVSYPRPKQRELIVCPIGTDYSVAHALHDFIEWRRLTLAPRHFMSTLTTVNFHLIPRLGNVLLKDFDAETVRGFMKDVLETPPKRGQQALGDRRPIDSIPQDSLRKRKGTLNAIMSTLRVAFQMAWENGKVDNERAWRCLRRLRVPDRPRFLHLSREECRELLDACEADLRRLVLGALYTGCRLSELVNLRCAHVGRDGYGVNIEPLKSKRARFVFLPDEAMAWFLDLAKGRKASDLIFARDDGRPWTDYYYNFKVAVTKAGLPKEFTFHGLRHTYASQLVQSGASVFAIAEQLGHADPSVVLRTYGHLTPQIRESEVRQRFSTLDIDNANQVVPRREELTAWRNSLHGGNWRTYAQITDIPPRETRVGG
jgi:integrase/recombinase XerD